MSQTKTLDPLAAPEGDSVRTVSLIEPERPSRWLGIRHVLTMLFRTTIFMCASLALAVAIVLALGSWQLSEDSLLIYILGIGVFVGVYWYLDIHRASRRRQRLRSQVLERAGSPANGLAFTNGQKGDFHPAGAIWLKQGGIAIGMDPKGQLARYVQRNPLRDELWIDNVFGLEMAPQIALLSTPTRGIANSLQRILGRPLKQRTILRLSDNTGQAAEFEIHPDHVAKAHDLVRQIDAERAKLTPSTS